MRPARRFQPRWCRGEEAHERIPVRNSSRADQPARSRARNRHRPDQGGANHAELSLEISDRGIFRNRISCGAYRFAYHEIDRLIARLVCVVHARSKAALQGGCKKPSREDDRKRRPASVAASSAAVGARMLLWMRSRANRPKHRRRFRSRPGIDATGDDADYCCSAEGPP